MTGIARHKIAILLHDSFEMWRPPAWFMERLRAEFPQVEIVHSSSKKHDEQALREADVMIGWSLPVEQLRIATSLRWIYSITAAVDQFLYPQLVASDIAICNAGAVHGPVVAEHAMAMVLALAKRLPSAVLHQKSRKWAMEEMWKEHPRPRELRGAVMTVVGLGSIGAEVASMAAALKMYVIGVREHPDRGSPGVNEVLSYQSLDSAIRRSDFVVLAAPLTPRTQKMINRRSLEFFKPDAYLINVSRGALIDEPALITALKNRRLGGAALDVFAEEPLPKRSPLWKMQQVLITPHTAFLTSQIWERHYAVFTSNLTRHLAGEPLHGTIDKKQGY